MIKKSMLIASLLMFFLYAEADVLKQDMVESGYSCEIVKKFNEWTKALEYECVLDQCVMDISIDKDDAGSFISLGYRLDKSCYDLQYPKKLIGWALLLKEAKKDGLLENLRRVGPGPGPAMCKGELRARLIETSSRLLSDKSFVKNNQGMFDSKGMYVKDLRFLWEHAGTFKEYSEIFDRLGYRLQLSEYEGVVFGTIKKGEIVRHDPSSKLEQLKIPCNAMTYFNATKNGGDH